MGLQSGSWAGAKVSSSLRINALWNFAQNLELGTIWLKVGSTGGLFVNTEMKQRITCVAEQLMIRKRQVPYSNIVKESLCSPLWSIYFTLLTAFTWSRNSIWHKRNDIKSMKTWTLVWNSYISMRGIQSLCTRYVYVHWGQAARFKYFNVFYHTFSVCQGNVFCENNTTASFCWHSPI
jgi:hypothetical protein